MDYLAWRGDLAFPTSSEGKTAQFCEVDNLILSMLSFIDFTGIVGDDPIGTPVKLSECFKKYRSKFPHGEEFGAVIPKITDELFEKTAATKRFSELYVACYREKSSESEMTQFAAVTFILPDNSLFVSFRGTDDTLNGWREDFNLSFTYPVASQTMAAAYLTDVASVYSGAIRCGGHSKGGHLAVYAACFAPKYVRDRIVTAYSNDGPGFVAEVVGSDEFREMTEAGKIYTIVPQSSVIGMLLEHSEDYKVIESTLSNGLFQHDPFSWSVLGPEFVHTDGLSKMGKMHDAVLGEWLGGMGADERREFTETLFGVIESTGAKTLTDFSKDGIGKLIAAVRAFGGIEKETRENVMKIIRRLAEIGIEWMKNAR